MQIRCGKKCESEKVTLANYEWVDWGKILSYNFVITAVLGARGCGKTYGCTEMMERARLAGKGKWVWIRDTKQGLDRFAADLGKTLSEIQLRSGIYGEGVTDVKVDYKAMSGKISVNGVHAGYTFLLSTAPQQKGSKYGKLVLDDDKSERTEEELAEIRADSIAWVVYDEFIDETLGRNLQLKNKCELFESAMESIARKASNTRFILMANKFSSTSELLRGWEIPVTTPGNVYRSPALVRNEQGEPILDDNGKPLTLRNLVGVFDLVNRPPGSDVHKNKISQIMSASRNGRYILNNKLDRPVGLLCDKLPKGLAVAGYINDDIKAVIYSDTNNKIYIKQSKSCPADCTTKICFNSDYIGDGGAKLAPMALLRTLKQCIAQGDVLFCDAYTRDWLALAL